MALNSRTNLKIIDAICEGPIDGLAQKNKSVFLNETLVTRKQIEEREDGVPPLVVYDDRTGTKDQPQFEETSLLRDVASTVIAVNEQVGRNFSEEVNDENKVVSRDYGAGNVVRAVTDSEAAFVELVFSIPKLYCVAPEGLARGQLFFAKIKLEVAIQDTTGFYRKVDVLAEGQEEFNVIKGISTSQYQFKTAPINLKNYKGERRAPYNIRVKKLEFDDAESAFEIRRADLEELEKDTPLANKRADTLIWNSIIVSKRVKTAYPFTALMHLSIDSEEYNTLPARAYDIRGKKVRIPSNATVRRTNDRLDGSLAFDDAKPFDGSLKGGTEWTTCPVCCFYNLLLNKRYGAGDFIDATNLNWVDLIELAKYCNEEVSTPEGPEPRFAINTVLGSQAEAYEVLQDMASVFRGMLFWKADNVQIAADHGNLGGENATALPAVHVFSNSNVVNGSFSYSGSSLKTRSTRVRVRYNDPDNFFKTDFVVIEDRTLVEKYGIQEKSIVAFGCSSKYQAQRLGRWVLQSEKLHDDTVSFSVGLEGLNVLPGQIFEVSDEMRLGTRLAGRIVGARLGFVDLDQTAVLPSGTNNKLTVVMKDGTIETRDIASVSGVRVTLSSDFTQVPPDDALYAIKNDSAVLRKYRCLSVAEGDAGVYGVIAVRHVDGIYKVVESDDAVLDLPPPFFYGERPSPPTDLRITFQGIDDGDNSTNRATISWSRGLSSSVAEFRVQWKVGDASNWNETFTSNTFLDVNSNLQPGKRLYAQVKAVGPAPDRHQSDWARVDSEIPVGNTGTDVNGNPIITLPPDPEEVTIEAFGVDQVILRWSPEADGQKVSSFVAVIRHSGKTDGSGTWPNSTRLRKVEARTTYAVLPLLNGEYLLKFENAQKQRSANAASALINIPDNIPRLNYEVIREDTPNNFPGDKVQTFYNSEYDGLVLSHDGSFDDIPDLDLFAANIDTLLGDQFLTGEYFFQNTVDLGAKFSLRIQRILTARGLYTSDLIDDRTALIDTWSDFDGQIPDDTNAEVYFRKSDLTATDSDIVNEDGDKLQLEDGSDMQQESDLVFDEWIPLENNVYVGRSFQFKTVLTTDHPDQTPIVDELGAILQFERRTENSDTIASGTGSSGKSVTFDNAFYTDGNTKVTVGITAFDLASGDYYQMSEPTGTGFTITFKNGSSVIDRNFQYTAIGYGTQQT